MHIKFADYNNRKLTVLQWPTRLFMTVNRPVRMMSSSSAATGRDKEGSLSKSAGQHWAEFFSLRPVAQEAQEGKRKI